MDTKRPKRRTDKDYPYTIQITESKKYTVSFTDGLGVLVPSRFMRKIVCRLRLSEVSRQ